MRCDRCGHPVGKAIYNGRIVYTPHGCPAPDQETARAGVGCTALVGAELSNRITDYLASGGLWNPEMALHDRVRDLLIDCRKYIDGTQAPTQRGAMAESHLLARLVGHFWASPASEW